MPMSYPHFGSVTYVLESLLQELGIETIFPKKPTRKTTELGARYGPEFVCTPFKLTLGTFIEMLDEGADVLGMGGGNAFCRFGYYWPVQKLILEDLGYKFRFINIDYWSAASILRDMKRESNGLNYLQTFRAFRITWIKNRLTDLVDKLLYRYRALEIEKGVTDKLAQKVFHRIVETRKISAIRNLYRDIPKIFKKEIEIEEKKKVLRVAVCGEIYVVLEPALNVDIHRRLNELGVIVESTVTLRRFTDVFQKLRPFHSPHWEVARLLGKPYVQYRVGGETQENLGEIVYYKKLGWDAIVHLYPFTCMPEIITRAIAPQVSKDNDMPFLSLVVDEHTGEAGFQTRLEAYVDLLRRRKQENKSKNEGTEKKHYNTEMGVYV